MSIRLMALLAAALVVAGCASPARVTYIPADAARAYARYHYAPAVRVGDTVILSGIPSGTSGDYEADIRTMFASTEATLALAGATFADVVELTTYHAQARDTPAFARELATFLSVHRAYFHEHYPAWTAVGTTVLLSPGSAVEMRVVAVVGSGRGARDVRGR